MKYQSKLKTMKKFLTNLLKQLKRIKIYNKIIINYYQKFKMFQKQKVNKAKVLSKHNKSNLNLLNYN